MEYLCNSGAGVAISTAAWVSKNTSKSSVRKHQKNGTKDSRENCQRREVWTNLGSTGFPDQKYSTCGKKIQEDLLANEMWTGRLRKNTWERRFIGARKSGNEEQYVLLGADHSSDFMYRLQPWISESAFPIFSVTLIKGQRLFRSSAQVLGWRSHVKFRTVNAS